MELFLHAPVVFMAWCLIKYRNNFTLPTYKLRKVANKVAVYEQHNKGYR
jgi:hypothetical protein